MSTWLHSLLIQELGTFPNPPSRRVTVRDYGKDSIMAVFHVEISNVSEGDEAISETPVTSVPPTIAMVMENN